MSVAGTDQDVRAGNVGVALDHAAGRGGGLLPDEEGIDADDCDGALFVLHDHGDGLERVVDGIQPSRLHPAGRLRPELGGDVGLGEANV